MIVYPLPTGFLIIDSYYSKRKLETLSIGDYGKENNIKADFLGYNKEINGVNCKKIKPLSEKWVMTLSTQYGCPIGCNFCDCSKIEYLGNVSFRDLFNQFVNARKCFENIKYTDRLNIHFARMGEPTLNYKNIFDFVEYIATYKHVLQYELDLRIEVIHPVFTTMLPLSIKEDKLEKILKQWCNIKNNIYNGQAGLQLSINSTDDNQRNIMFNNNCHNLETISYISKSLPNPLSRKYCLNFAYASNFKINQFKLAELFEPNKFMCKITPIHNNISCKKNKIETINGYTSYNSYREVEQNLKSVGFDVLVFIPSLDEEKSLITCGNAILSGSKIEF
jgi:23S rRNA (adenine2503-C2)-methyltransferase